MNTYEAINGKSVEIPDGRPRNWGPPRRCPACGEQPVFSIVYRRTTGGVSSHINKSGVRQDCQKRDG